MGIAAACSSSDASAPGNTGSIEPSRPSPDDEPRLGSASDASGSDIGASLDVNAGDAVDAGMPPKGPPPIALPFTYTRNDIGIPLTAQELATATDELIQLLKDTRYFDFVDERMHGWPETDPNHGFWYGHYWSGISLTKSGGKVTYKHSHDGADNVGLRTSQYLEGACYGHLLWGAPLTAHLVQKMARAYSAWILAMVRSTNDTNPTLLARSFYRPNVDSTEGGRDLTIDYSAS